MTHSPSCVSKRRLLRSCTALTAAFCLLFASGCSALPASQPAPVAEVTERYEDGINVLMLVNGDHSLPEGYEIELTELSNGQRVASVMYEQLQAMFDDMREQGVYPVVASGYRTPEKQQSLMDEKILQLQAEGLSMEEAVKEARKWVNPVGCSEHQSGLAVDINADGVHSTGKEVYNWLAAHAWDYGFILRYPKSKRHITNTSYEPWHYRYVGIEAAQKIRDWNVCLEEYLGQA